MGKNAIILCVQFLPFVLQCRPGGSDTWFSLSGLRSCLVFSHFGILP